MTPFFTSPVFVFLDFPSNAKLSDPRTVFGFPIMEVSQKPREIRSQKGQLGSKVRGLKGSNWG